MLGNPVSRPDVRYNWTGLVRLWRFPDYRHHQLLNFYYNPNPPSRQDSLLIFHGINNVAKSLWIPIHLIKKNKLSEPSM
jgi:hypothetical protein